MANPLEQGPKRYDDALERIDRVVYRVEAGVMSFALLAMSLTFFLKIIYEAVIAERNFVDAFLLRWLHGTETEAPDALIATVHGLYTPSLVTVALLLLGVGAARTATQQIAKGRGDAERPPWSAMTFVAGVAIAAAFAATGWLVVVVPSRIATGALYVLFLGMFAARARRHGELGPFFALWIPLSLPVGVLIARIPEQYAWVNDLSKVLIMYVGFLGASMASREQKHILLNFGRKLWPAAARRGFEVVSLTIWLGFNLLLLALGYHLFALHQQAGSMLSILPIAEYHISLPVLISFALMSMRVAVDLFRVITGATPVAAAAEGAAEEAA